MDDGNGLENRSGRKLTGGSNPSPSARKDEQQRISNQDCNWFRLFGLKQIGEMPEWSNGAAC